MIHWCAYCQTYRGESAPFDVFSVTHGICERCMAAKRYDDSRSIAAAKRLAAFFERSSGAALSGTALRPDLLLAEAEELGVRPLDMLVGLLQPLLYQLGELWASGRVPVSTEHELSMTTEVIAMSVRQRLLAPSALDPTAKPEFLLVASDGNYHTLGLRIVEVHLLSSGHSTRLVLPGLPTPEVAALVRALEPRVLGISTCRDDDVELLRGLRALLDELEPGKRPRLLVGGHAIRQGRAPDPALGFEVCLDALDVMGRRDALRSRSPRP